MKSQASLSVGESVMSVIQSVAKYSVCSQPARLTASSWLGQSVRLVSQSVSQSVSQISQSVRLVGLSVLKSDSFW